MVNVELRARVCGGYVVVMPRGELDTVDAGSTGSTVAELAESGRHLAIDLRSLEYVGCHAGEPPMPGVLDQGRRRARAPGAG
jgi:anti-anti-sigma regulatory factor